MFPTPQLDAGSTVPLYRQVFDYLKDSIQSGKLARGSRLPATRELAGLLGLNRTTVSAAYELLESEGLIAGHVGRGSFVTGAPVAALDWNALLNSSEPAPRPPASRDEISFAASRPAEDLFPIDEFRATCEEVTNARDISAILQLGSPGGYGPLRQYLIERARAEGVLGNDDDLLITSGCQQALDLLQRVLIVPGDKIALEDPVYPGLKNLLLRSGARLSGVAIGADGISLDDLEGVLDRDRPKLLVVTSNFQNPTGATLPLSARRAVLQFARNAGVVVVENDSYGDLRYDGDALPPLKRLDESGATVLLRSFSKIAFPGLRVGWAIGRRELIARMTEAKQLSDLHTDQLSQAVLLRFAESGRLEAHRENMLRNGAERLRAALSACQHALPPGSSFTRPRGGMNLWVRLPAPLDSGELLPRAQREGVGYLPGKYFAVSHHDPGAFRLSFAALPPKKIARGLKILGEVFTSELERSRTSRALEPAQLTY